MTPHPAALPRTARPLWLLVLLSLLTWLAACSDSPPPEPVISVQPSDASAVAGTAATLSVTASGPDIGYQWQLSTDGGTTWAHIAGATQASHTTAATTPADNGRRYRVVVSASGISLTSSAVTLTVTAAVVAPALTVQPAAQTATAPATATFSVTVTGTAPGYQWQRSTDNGATWVNIAGATAASYSTGSTDVSMNASQYRVVVANSAGSVTSTAVVLSVAAAPLAAAFTTQPADQSVSAGSAAAFTVAATGNPTPTLQWQRSTDNGSTWSNIAAATGSTHNTGLTALGQNGERYRALAGNSAGSATSNAALLTVSPAPQAPAITAQPANQSVTAPATATFAATASGVPTPAWQWQLSTNSGVSWANVGGATAASYTTPATSVADSGKRYRAVASNASATVNSDAATLTVTAPVVGRAWQTALLIETGDAGEAGLPQVAVNAPGDAIAVWQQSDGVSIDIYANRYTTAAGWGTAQRIEIDNTGVAQNAQVALDNSGNAIAVWQQRNGAGRDDIWANRYTAGSGWGAAALIESGFFDAGNPQVAIDGSGNAIAVWWQSDGGRNNLVANRYVAGSGWGTAAMIETDSTGDVSAPQIAMDAGGNAIAVWAWASAVPNGPTYEYTVWANRYTAASGWGTAGPIDSVNNSTANPAPHVALDGSGNAIAVWHRPDGSWDSIWANRYAAGSGWGTSVLVETDNTNSARAARVALDASGNAFAVWTQSFGGVANVMANRYAAGIGWGTAVLIETDDAGPAFEPRLVVDGNGNATAVWSQRNIGGFTFNIWTNRFTAGTGWGTARMIDNDPSPASAPQIGVDANGNAVSVWQQDSGGVRPSIWANGFR